MELSKAIELFKEKKRISMAYGHAFGVMSFDNETAAPKNSAIGLAKTFEVLSELDYKLTVNNEYFEVIDVLTEKKMNSIQSPAAKSRSRKKVLN